MKTSRSHITPSLEEFKKLSSEGNLIPVFAVISMDNETPVSVFQKLRPKLGYSFILESAERTGAIGRYSFIGRNPRALFRANGKKVTITQDSQTRTFESQPDPLKDLERFMMQFQYVDHEELPQFKGGMVGYIGYEVAHFFEPKAREKELPDQLGVPDVYFMLANEVVCLDHLTRRLHIISNVSTMDGDISSAYENACKKIENVMRDLDALADLPKMELESEIPEITWNSNTTRDEFCAMVASAKERIVAGDIMQAVLSQRFEADYSSDPFGLYRTLWMVNPSPYMFLISFGDELTLVGSSPEVHVRSINRKVEIRPIAGTRRRGKTKTEDSAMADELLADPKERAEHVMLIDLARNDIGRIAQYGSVQVTEQFGIERFSHVMHIVSNVVGRLSEGLTSFDVMRATFPAGTVSGAPKIQAMKIINRLEKSRRGAYAGAVGYFGFDGNLDSCIALRTVVLKNARAYIQAGAGVVADSTPEGEFEECRNKAKGMLVAIARANQMVRQMARVEDVVV